MVRKKTRGNGQGSVVRVRANNYKAIVTVGYKDNDPTKPIRRTKSGFPTRTEALEYISILRRTPKEQKKTLATYYEGYASSSMLKLSESQQGKLKRAKERLKDIWFVDITMLTIKDLQDAVNNTSDSYYARKDCVSLIKHLYKRAEAQGDVQKNLGYFIELPEHTEEEQEPFTETEVNLFWKDFAAGNVFTGFILLMIYTGMMPGELMDCTKSMINIENRVIVGAGKKTKTRKSRPIVLAESIIPVVEQLLTYSNTEKLMPHYKTTFYDFYNRTIKRIGVRELPPYSCRHTTATALARIESNAQIIKEVMRHSQIQTTQRYIHLDTKSTLDAVNKI